MDQGFNADSAKTFMVTLLAGHVANSVLYELLRARQPDDIEKIPAWLISRLTLGLFDGIPIFRDMANMAEGKIVGEPGKDIRNIPVLQAGADTVDAALKSAKAIMGEGEAGPAVRKTARAVGAWTGLPTMQGTITGQYIYDQLTGEYEPERWYSPVTDIFYARHRH
jgi:hypothetical protein